MRPDIGWKDQDEARGLDQGHELAFVEDFDSNLVTLTYAANDILFWNLEVVKVEGASRRCPYSELLFLFCNFDAHVPGGDETCDAFIAFAGVNLWGTSEGDRKTH